MNVLVIGSGGREHALVWKIRQSPLLERLYCTPGNPGIENLAEPIPVSPSDLNGLLRVAREHNVDLTVVGPEQPLAEGIVDLFQGQGLRIFGPTKRAAQLEWSKSFAKDFMRRHAIPTALHETFTLAERAGAVNHLRAAEYPVVLKADGLAGGKGVVICHDRESALDSLHQMMDEKAFGPSNDTVVIEEFMTGQEASLFAICDGVNYTTLAPARDYKRVFDDDKGKNTGGMGAYAPAPVVTTDVLDIVKRTIIVPTLFGMAEEGRPYRGCLYVGLMITPTGPKVVEYNCRFGDPETQVVLPLYDGDLLSLMYGVSEGRMDANTPSSPPPRGSAVCVVLVSAGYPDKYDTGMPISGLEDLSGQESVVTFHSGTRSNGGTIVTAGGRVLGVTAISASSDLERTIAAAYDGVQRVSFQGMHYRRDIGRKAVNHSHHRPETSGIRQTGGPHTTNDLKREL
jgi:phosphoribosylamine--glycine ligase